LSYAVLSIIRSVKALINSGLLILILATLLRMLSTYILLTILNSYVDFIRQSMTFYSSYLNYSPLFSFVGSL